MFGWLFKAKKGEARRAKRMAIYTLETAGYCIEHKLQREEHSGNSVYGKRSTSPRADYEPSFFPAPL